MYKYAQLKRYHHNCRLIFYIYYSTCVDPETISMEYHFLATNCFVLKCKKMYTQGTVTKTLLGFSYRRQKYYEFDQKFDERGKKSEHTPNNKVKTSRKKIGN